METDQTSVNQASPAAPVAGPGGAAPPELSVVVRGMLERGQASIFRLEPRVELLTRACYAHGMLVGLGDEPDYAYPLSPRTEQVLAYLVGAIPHDGALAKRVHGAVMQYFLALRVFEDVETALLGQSLQMAQVNTLRNALFFLSRFGEQFREDVMLSSVFPPPQTMQASEAARASTGALPAPQAQLPTPVAAEQPPAPAPTEPENAGYFMGASMPPVPQALPPVPQALPPVPQAQSPVSQAHVAPPRPAVQPGRPAMPPGQPQIARPRQPLSPPPSHASNDPLVGKVERLLAYHGPRMEVVRLVNQMLDPTQVSKLSDLNAPSARNARTLAAVVKKQNRTLMGQLAEAYALYVQLTRDQRNFHNGLSDTSKQAYFKLRVHSMNFLKEPLLKEIFPLSDKRQLDDA